MVPLRYPIAPYGPPWGALEKQKQMQKQKQIHEQKQKGVGGGAAPYKGACAPLTPDRPGEDCI